MTKFEIPKGEMLPNQPVTLRRIFDWLAAVSPTDISFLSDVEKRDLQRLLDAHNAKTKLPMRLEQLVLLLALVNYRHPYQPAGGRLLIVVLALLEDDVETWDSVFVDFEKATFELK